MRFEECIPSLYEGKEIMSKKLNKTLKLSPELISQCLDPRIMKPLIPETDDWEVAE